MTTSLPGDNRHSLLELHSAEAPEHLWQALEPLALAATGSEACMLCLNILGLRPQHCWSTHDHHHSLTAESFGRLMNNTFVPDFLQRFPGEPVFSVSRMFPDRRLWYASAFFQEFFAPYGWDDHCGIFVLDGAMPVASLGLMRRAEHGPYLASEVQSLECLLAHFQVVARRVVRQTHARAVMAEVDSRYGDLFEPAMVLDWHFNIHFCSQQAQQICRRWGATGAIATHHSPVGESLPALLSGCLQRLRAAVEERLCSDGTTGSEMRLRCQHPEDPSLSLVATALLAPATPHGLPLFHIQFESVSNLGTLSRSWTEVALLLSPAERQIAILACKGLGNDEIAGQTGKSVDTVKRQLSTVYRKLGVRSRSRLIAELGHRVPR